MWNKLLLTYILLLLGFQMMAQPKQYIWNDKSQQIYESITSLRIPEARKNIAIEKKAIPNNLINEMLESYADFYELFLNEDVEEYKRINPQFDRRIKLFENGPKNSPYYQYCLGLEYLHKSIVAIMFDKIWDGVWDFRKAYFLFKENRKAYPNFTPNEMYYGVITTVVGTIPKGYQWIANILGLSGKISEGNALVLKYINSKDEYNKRCRNEALFIYPYLLMNFEGNAKKAFNFIESGPYDFKRNQMHTYMAANLYLNHQQSNKALSLIQQVENNSNYLPLPFWNLELGYAYLNELKLDKAQKHLTEFTQGFKGKFYVKDAYERLSWIAYFQGDIKKAEAYRKSVLTMSNQVTDADKQAYQNAKKGDWPNPLLLKARLLSDGGYQLQALNILTGKTSNDFPIDADKTEFAYRLGRIYDLMEQDEAAIKFYVSAIEKGEHQPEYFAARAALQIGNIYENKGQFAKAIEYYNSCIEMKDHAFKNSLDQKAKAGIQRCIKQ
jgi:tetratricopeptide (TPR) repeat protein